MSADSIVKTAFLDACSTYQDPIKILKTVIDEIVTAKAAIDDEAKRLLHARALLKEMSCHYYRPRKIVHRQSLGCYSTFYCEVDVGADQLILDVLEDCGFDESYIQQMEKIFNPAIAALYGPDESESDSDDDGEDEPEAESVSEDLGQIAKSAFLDACGVYFNVFDILNHVVTKVIELMALTEDEVGRLNGATNLLAHMKSFCNHRKTVFRDKIGSYPTFCGATGVSQLIIDVLNDCGYDEDYIERMEAIFYSEDYNSMEIPALEAVPCARGVDHTPPEPVPETVPEKVETVPEKVETVPEKVESVPEKVETVPEKVGKTFEEPIVPEKEEPERNEPTVEGSSESPVETQEIQLQEGAVHFAGLTLNPPTYKHHHHIRPYKPRHHRSYRPQPSGPRHHESRHHESRFPRYSAPALRQRFWCEIGDCEAAHQVLSSEYHETVLRIGEIQLNPKYILERGDIRIKMIEGCIRMIKTSKWDSDKLKAMKNAEKYFLSFHF